jgi:AraC-like DNA-binding protein
MMREAQAMQRMQKEQLERLMKYFSEEKPWMNPLLRSKDVIKVLNMNRTDFWRLLKQTLAGNFNDFVNGYRVEEAKRLIRNGHDYEKTGNIAQVAGFNSYSTFLRSFRKIARCSPQEYGGNLQVKQEEEMVIAHRYAAKPRV